MLFVSKYLEIVQQVFLGPAINFFKKKNAIFFLICSMVNSKKIKKNQHEKCSNGKGGSNSTKKKKRCNVATLDVCLLRVACNVACRILPAHIYIVRVTASAVKTVCPTVKSRVENICVALVRTVFTCSAKQQSTPSFL